MGTNLTPKRSEGNSIKNGPLADSWAQRTDRLHPPAVLLGMGFAADYLAHATAEHPPTRMDTYARWLAALTSVSIFAMIAFADFPPAMNTGQLLTASILFSVILATCLSFKQLQSPEHDTEE